MAELASKKGASAGGDDAAAKKAAFLKEAEEAVRRAAQTEADRKSADKNTEVVPTPSTRVCVCQKGSICVFIPAEMRHAIDAQMPLYTPRACIEACCRARTRSHARAYTECASWWCANNRATESNSERRQ